MFVLVSGQMQEEIETAYGQAARGAHGRELSSNQASPGDADGRQNVLSAVGVCSFWPVKVGRTVWCSASDIQHPSVSNISTAYTDPTTHAMVLGRLLCIGYSTWAPDRLYPAVPDGQNEAEEVSQGCF